MSGMEIDSGSNILQAIAGAYRKAGFHQ